MQDYILCRIPEYFTEDRIKIKINRSNASAETVEQFKICIIECDVFFKLFQCHFEISVVLL